VASLEAKLAASKQRNAEFLAQRPASTAAWFRTAGNTGTVAAGTVGGAAATGARGGGDGGVGEGSPGAADARRASSAPAGHASAGGGGGGGGGGGAGSRRSALVVCPVTSDDRSDDGHAATPVLGPVDATAVDLGEMVSELQLEVTRGGHAG